MRIVGMDIHRVATEVVVLHEGRFTKLGRVPMLHKSLEAFATKELTHDDHVVIEATGNASSILAVLESFVDRDQPEAGADDRTRKGQNGRDRRGGLGKALCHGLPRRYGHPTRGRLHSDVRYRAERGSFGSVRG